ncbi:DUF4405 domain-containing protein [Pelosinus baikalensis]|uniref:DUF4405 domain-containing protein n=1 Tax=Pelosinus baikalensis TaxID=2892015 RepID=A0ABS8I1L6_9FIRM|nr:DUF4405 domain-containing protein [Pelosinus baikalensis]MCC5468683.1 DUF4405 domain-containing protein [Pelosinus baikalensis]
MQMRRITSITLMMVFIFVAVTGIEIDIADKKILFLKRLHEWTGYILIILGLIHLFFNRKAMMSYIRTRS